MRFEHLTRKERAIYQLNFALGEEGPPPPVRRWKKIVAVPVVIILTLFPMYYLIMFGAQQERHATRAWLVSTVICMALEGLIYDPLVIIVMYIASPMLIRRKIKHLADPTSILRFPSRSDLLESPSAYLAHRHHDLKVARAFRQARHHNYDGALDDMTAELPRAQHRKVSARRLSSAVIIMYSIFLAMPEAIQEAVLKDLLMVLTLVYQWIVHLLASLASQLGMAGVGAVVFVFMLWGCNRRHRRATELDNANEADSDEDDDDDLDGCWPTEGPNTPRTVRVGLIEVELFVETQDNTAHETVGMEVLTF